MSSPRSSSVTLGNVTDPQVVIPQDFPERATTHECNDGNNITTSSQTENASIHIPTFQQQQNRRRPRQRSLFDYLPQAYRLRFGSQ